MLKPLIYRDVDPNRYIVSDKGEIFKSNGKKLNGCNKLNEKRSQTFNDYPTGREIRQQE
jgi:hypothetical protein